jgi:feS assembly ATPase sufC
MEVYMLKINNLSAKVVSTGTCIIDKLNLEIGDGEIHAIMGPNGTGKSTLSKVIMGHYQYEIVDGEIYFNDKLLNGLDTCERARCGIFLSMQDPAIIDGVSTSEFIRTAVNEVSGEKSSIFSFVKELESNMEQLHLNKDMVHRSLNKGFSGGEKKKNEILQLKFLKPKFIILDELDSGLDVDSLKIVCREINSYKKDHPDTSILIITHYPRILEMIVPHFVHIMNNGSIKKTGDKLLALEVEKDGYDKYE